MFSRVKDPSTASLVYSRKDGYEETIQRKTFEQVELEQMWEILSEMRDEIKTLRGELLNTVRQELRSQSSKFETWEDLNRIAENNRMKERELEVREKYHDDINVLHSKILKIVNDNILNSSINNSPKQKTINEGNNKEIQPPPQEVDG